LTLGLLLAALSGPGACAQQPSGPKTDVAEIVKLLQAGLGEDIIIEKLRKDGKAYDLSGEDLIELKKAGATSAILKAMINAGGQPPAAPSEAAVAGLPDEQGVYIKVHGQWTAIDAQVVNSRTANIIGHAFSYGISKAKLKGDVDGAKSKLQVPNPVEILIKCPEGTSATEYRVLRMEEKKDRREFEFYEVGFASAKAGTRKGIVEVKFEKIGKAMYKGVLTNVNGGEYGILPPGAVMERGVASIGKVYGFGIIE
jgi:hypothetical protein